MDCIQLTRRAFAGYFFRSGNRAPYSQGFTLLETLIIALIIGILAALALPSYLSMIDKTKYGEAKTQMNCMAKELLIFRLENGYYPADVDRNIPPKYLNSTRPALNCFYQSNSGKVPFDSQYDYENWQRGGLCQIRVTFLGKDNNKDSQSQNKSLISHTSPPGFYEFGDDLVLTVDTYPCP